MERVFWSWSNKINTIFRFRFNFSAQRLSGLEFTGVVILFILIAIIAIVPVVKHIIWCIQAAADSMQPVALLVAGLIIPPLGWLHGVSLFLGYTWLG